MLLLNSKLSANGPYSQAAVPLAFAQPFKPLVLKTHLGAGSSVVMEMQIPATLGQFAKSKRVQSGR